jgi:hypothetical protein
MEGKIWRKQLEGTYEGDTFKGPCRRPSVDPTCGTPYGESLYWNPLKVTPGGDPGVNLLEDSTWKEPPRRNSWMGHCNGRPGGEQKDGIFVGDNLGGNTWRKPARGDALEGNP